MGSRYLTDLADVVRAAGILVHEEPGWQTRARSSGGFDSGRPDHVMVHHTASGPSSDGQADVNYMCYGSDSRPIANLYLSRDGIVWVMAAGATNTNGSGRCPHCGATDNMNSRAIGIECANGGTGEAYPQRQQEVYSMLVRGLTGHYGIPIAAVQAHFAYAPDRKIDPSGPARWSPHPTGGGGGNEWLMDAFRADVAAGWPQPTPPEPKPPEDDDDMEPYLVQRTADNKVYAVHPKGCVYLQYTAMINNYKALGYKLIPIDDQAWRALTKLYPVST